MGFDISYSSSGPGMDGIMRGIDALNGADALVGIPEGNAPRKKGDINNAELLFLFTNGSPLRGTPGRVVIEAAIEAEPTKDLIAKEMAAAATAALDGDEKGMMDHLDRAGTIAESASKRWFTDPRNGWEPNAPSTIRAKGSETPGISTGQMRRAITHIVEAGGAVHTGNGPELEAGDDISFGTRAEEEVEDAGEELAEILEVV
jgi:hypothetical protein